MDFVVCLGRCSRKRNTRKVDEMSTVKLAWKHGDLSINEIEAEQVEFDSIAVRDNRGIENCAAADAGGFGIYLFRQEYVEGGIFGLSKQDIAVLVMLCLRASYPEVHKLLCETMLKGVEEQLKAGEPFNGATAVADEMRQYVQSL
jgi:hypothetical protein